jgi:two-component system cell cycle response regulator DivK
MTINLSANCIGNVASPIVLVVEDHEDTRTMLKVLLEMRGYRVLEADNGLTAIELAESRRPNLILMDARLPLLDGLSVTRRIRKTPSLRHTPIIAITGNATAAFGEEMIAAGCEFCVVKPIDFDRFEELIDGLLQREAAIALPPRYALMLRSHGVLVEWHRL